MTVFFLGTHEPSWLARLGVPLFVSDRRLRRYRRLPQAIAPWALDSGGFSELDRYGSWEHGPTPAQYVARIRRYQAEIGQLRWAAPQDWMCEPWIVAKTGRTVREHQARTVGNFLDLRSLAPELPIVPVVQGWSVAEYLACVDRYAAAGVDLTAEPVVGVGSMCRRAATAAAEQVLATLRGRGLSRLHGFGFKITGLRRSGHMLASADSMAWSYAARRDSPLPGCDHRGCQNCSRYALRWRARVLATLERRLVVTAFATT